MRITIKMNCIDFIYYQFYHVILSGIQTFHENRKAEKYVGRHSQLCACVYVWGWVSGMCNSSKRRLDYWKYAPQKGGLLP